MESTNCTGAAEFLLLGLSEDPGLRPMLSGLFLSVYLVTALGNLLIALAIAWDSRLHTPMYFFLFHLSLADVCMGSATVPQMLVHIHTRDGRVTHAGCLAQACFVLFVAGLENCLLVAMAYDRYVAICRPLRYTAIMNAPFCGLTVLWSVMVSLGNALLLGLMALRLSFRPDLEIPHFFCELAQVIRLSCSDTFINNILVYVAAFIFGGVPFSGIIFSYTEIVSSVLKIPSAQGRYKAFSTCGSHLSVVSLFYGSGLGVYISSAVTESPRKTAVASLMYTVVTQMLNPFIYSLRNRDMKDALRKLFGRMASLLQCRLPWTWLITKKLL